MANKKQQDSPIPEGQQVTMGDTFDAPSLGRWQAPSERYIKAIFNEFFAKKEQAVADLEVYLENPVGVGEHSNIAEEIKLKIQEIDKYDSLVETIKSHFMSGGEQGEDQTP